eukprot:13709596-Alexandrium_andersonii.AAC.1
MAGTSRRSLHGPRHGLLPRQGASSALRLPPADLPLRPRARPARRMTTRPSPPSGPCLTP